MVPSESASSSRVMPMPLSSTASVLRVLVEADRDLEGRGGERRIGERLVTQFLAGVGGVGEQLAQENIAVGIDRMHHQMEQPGDIGLKSLRMTRGF